MLADCIVVGGGIVGAAAAWRLQQRGLRVLLLDRQQPGLEASFAGAGMLSPGGEDLGDGYWLDAALESRRMYAAFVTELVGASGLAIDYQDCGALEWILPEAETRLQRLRTRGVFMEDRSEAGQHKLWFPGDGSVEPRDVMAALRKLLASCTLQEEVKTINPGRIVPGLNSYKLPDAPPRRMYFPCVATCLATSFRLANCPTSFVAATLTCCSAAMDFCWPAAPWNTLASIARLMPLRWKPFAWMPKRCFPPYAAANPIWCGTACDRE
jgi:hypothetical protein